MIRKKRLILQSMMLSIMLLCSCAKIENSGVKSGVIEKEIKYTDIIFSSSEEADRKILNLKENYIEEIDKVKNLVDIKYTGDSKIKVGKINSGEGNNLIKNYLKIYIETKEKRLDDSYSYRSFNLSENGEFLAYISYEKDDTTSVKDLEIYDIKKDKKLSLPEDYVVSGDLYQFSKEELFFYGVNLKEGKSNIFRYNIKSDEISEVMGNLSTEVRKFFVFNDYLYYTTTDEENSLHIFNVKNKSMGISYNDMSNYFNYAKAGDSLYIIGENSIKNTEVYKITGEDIKKITYDFPSYINKDGGIAFDGIYVYFLGHDKDNNTDIFIYDTNDGFVKTSNLSYKDKIEKIFSKE